MEAVIMIISLNEQTLLFLSTILAGMGMAFTYDIFRLLRKFIKHSSAFVYLEDIIYWIIVTFAVFYFLLTQNYGEIRIFLIIGLTIGAVLYFSALSPLVMRISTAATKFAIKVITAVFMIILSPIKLLLKIIYIFLKPIITLIKVLIKNMAEIRKKLLQKFLTCVK